MFSDLHVNRKTSPVCMQVLRAVHDAAESRDAGIVFLGDFWHARGGGSFYSPSRTTHARDPRPSCFIVLKSYVLRFIIRENHTYSTPL